MLDASVIRKRLADAKRYGVPFDQAWQSAAGAVPRPPLPNSPDGESLERATYRYMRAAYLNVGPPVRFGLVLAENDDASVPGRSAVRAVREAA